MVNDHQNPAVAALGGDIGALRKIGRSTGFPPRLRRKIWPVLLGLTVVESPKPVEDPHEDEKQVLLDTKRSFTACYPSTLDTEAVENLKHDLQFLICQVLRRNQWLHYYQGFHDIAQTVLLVMGRSASVETLEALSVIYLRDFMLSTLAPSMSMLQLVHQIINIADPPYAQELQAIEPYYAISTLLTWWIHSLTKFPDACRLFDFLLSSPPVTILYTVAASAILRKDKVAGCEGDPDMIFHSLSTGLGDMDIEAVIALTCDLYEGIKPRQLRHWAKLSSHSCLKTFPAMPLDLIQQRGIAKEHFELLVVWPELQKLLFRS